jgi:hypothetical protein
MAAEDTRHLTPEQIRAIASESAAIDEPEGERQSGGRMEQSWRRACDRLARSLLGETWNQSSAVDIGFWGRWIYQREAATYLSDLAERGTLYISPSDAIEGTEPARANLLSRLRRYVRRGIRSGRRDNRGER